MGSPVLPQFSLCACRRHYPGGAAGCLSLSSPAVAAFPVQSPGQPPHRYFPRPARRLLTLQPAHSRSRLTTLSIERFRQVVAFLPAPIATGWSDPCREGLAPSQELCLSTAHDCFVASAPRNDVVSRHTSAVSPRAAPELCQKSFALQRRGRREGRVPNAPAASCALGVVKYAHEYSQRRHRDHPAFPAQWF
jgi:hypothetical protein